MTPGFSNLTWGPPGPRLGLAVMGQGPRWPSSDLVPFLSSLPGTQRSLGGGECGAPGAGGFSSPGDSQDGQEWGWSSLQGSDPSQPWAGAPPASLGTLPSHSVQTAPPRPPWAPSRTPHSGDPAGPEPGVSAPSQPAMAPLVPLPTARPHGQRGLPGVHLCEGGTQTMSCRPRTGPRPPPAPAVRQPVPVPLRPCRLASAVPSTAAVSPGRGGGWGLQSVATVRAELNRVTAQRAPLQEPTPARVLPVQDFLRAPSVWRSGWAGRQIPDAPSVHCSPCDIRHCPRARGLPGRLGTPSRPTERQPAARPTAG